MYTLVDPVCYEVWQGQLNKCEFFDDDNLKVHHLVKRLKHRLIKSDEKYGTCYLKSLTAGL